LINSPSIHGKGFTREGRCTQEASLWGTLWPPVSLAYLAAVVARGGDQPLVYDCAAAQMSLARLLGTLEKEQPAALLLPTSTPSFFNDMSVIDSIKKRLPPLKTAVFGVHATAADTDLLRQYPAVDFVIRNEPEQTAAALIDALKQDRSLAEVTGLTFRGPENVMRNPDRPFIADLDALPFPAWEYLDLDDYRLPFRGRRFLCLAPSRGCPSRCSFCTAGVYYGRRLRLRGVNSVIGEIKHDQQKFGVGDFFMWAETFTRQRDFVLELTAAMKTETPGIRWTCNSRLDTVDAELLVAMAAAGCWMMSFGIESTDATVQKKSNKNLQSPEMFEPLRLARKAGIRTVGHFIFGLPGETPASMRQTIHDALKMDLDFVQFYTAAPFIGSDLYEEARQKGWLDHSTFDRMNQAQASLQISDLPPGTVNQAVRQALWSFYMRPRQILRLLRFAGAGIFYQALKSISVLIKSYKVRLEASIG